MFCNDSRGNILHSCRGRNFVLASIWFLGVFTGSLYGWHCRSFFARIIYRNIVMRTDLFTQFLALSFAFILPFFFGLFRCRFAIYGISFLEGSAFSAVLIGLVGGFPRFGWLLALLFLAPKALFLIAQFLYWRVCLRFTISSALKFLVPLLIAYQPVLFLNKRLIEPTIFFLLDYL